MISGKALLVSVPLVVAGGVVMGAAHARVGALRAELASTEERGRAEGESYLRTLQGAHAQRQLELLTQRHDVALRLAGARRDRLLGLLVVLAGLLTYGFVQVAQRVAGEIDEAGRLPGPPPGRGWRRRARPGRCDPHRELKSPRGKSPRRPSVPAKGRARGALAPP